MEASATVSAPVPQTGAVTVGKKSYKGLVITGIVLLGFAGAGYFVFIRKNKDGKTIFEGIGNKSGSTSSMTRDEAIKIIEDYSKTKFAIPNTYGTDYLVARASAIKSETGTFTLNGKSYNTVNGKAV
jgi:hypothetical protein